MISTATIQTNQQLLKMNNNFYQEFTSKRVKERSIGDAYYRVQQWRYFFRNGIQENGIFKKITLKEAADIVKVPKKTLEDYIQIFNKVELIINIEEIAEKKMGYLRSFMKKNKSKIRKEIALRRQKKLEENLKNKEASNNIQPIQSEDEQQTNHYPNIDILSINIEEETYEDEYSNFIFNKLTSKCTLD
ncbi:unnamed protein product [Paramecium sonneborni]|uniref:Uncharacterized protein n=1 Tax=Paramecium sonneborni TaxID=65129 RepID=A0A8S1NFP9_9CILI|nr:unnamed protein product [Paramecium sonneborni]